VTRFLVLLLLAILLGLAIDRAVSRFAAKLGGGERRRAAGDGSSRPAVTETLVRCARCGVHVPRSRTVTDSRGRIYCSDRCREG
jgi:hypothetical protein